jgi:DNA-binding NarL/FixJ family response regulator
MGGKEAMKRLREIDPSVKAIVSSGYSDDPVMANYAAYGFNGVVSKPYTIHKLGEIIGKVLAGS